MATPIVQASPMVANELISFRAAPGTLDRAEKLAKQVEKASRLAGLGISRSKILALALERGLTQLEVEHEPAKKGGKR